MFFGSLRAQLLLLLHGLLPIHHLLLVELRIVELEVRVLRSWVGHILSHHWLDCLAWLEGHLRHLRKRISLALLALHLVPHDLLQKLHLILLASEKDTKIT